MEGEAVKYKGCLFPKESFRVFVYDEAGNKKLCESWDDYCKARESALWFDDKPEKKEVKTDTPIKKKKQLPKT